MQSAQERDPTLKDLLRVFDKRRKTVLWTLAAVFLLAVLACIFMTRRYTATSEIELQKSTADGMNLDNLLGAGESSGSDALSVNIDLQTQTSVLGSEDLALKVIKDQNLEQNVDFKPRFSPVGFVLGMFSPSGPSDPANADLAHSPKRRMQALAVFKKNLKVSVVAGTRLMTVSYSNPDPKVAAAVANDLVQSLVDFTLDTRTQASNQVSGWLENQMSDLRKQSQDLQAKVVALQKNTGLFGVVGSDLQGKPITYSPTLDSLQQTTAQLSQAESNRVLKGAVNEVVKTGNAELISQLSGTNMGGSSGGQGTTNSLSLVQSLRTQEATLEAQIAQDSAIYGPAFPKLVQERASLKRVQQSLHEEIERLAARAKSDYEVALNTERGTRKAYDEQVGAAQKLNNNTVAYSLLEKEASQSQDLYQGLLKRLKEAGVMQGLRSTNITIVDLATPPAKPSRPNVPLYLALGLLLGAVFGGAGALLVDSVDNKLQGVDDIEAMGLPVVGILPRIKNIGNLTNPEVAENPTSVFSESVRGLRSVLLMSRAGRAPQVILVTSGSPNEGKSTVSLNLAVSLAQQGKRVLFVEADLRHPVVANAIGITAKEGLSTLLTNQSAPFAPKPLPAQPNLSILPGGPVPPFPAELLSSTRMVQLIEEWRKQYDVILIDSPPILHVADARDLSPFADATLLIARGYRTSRLALQRTYDILLQHSRPSEAPSTFVVLNAMTLRSAGRDGYYGGGKSPYYGKGGARESV